MDSQTTKNVILFDEVQGSIWTRNGFAAHNELDQAERFTPADGLKKAFELQAESGSPIEIHRYHPELDESHKVIATDHARAWPVTERAFKNTLEIELNRAEYLDARDGAAERVSSLSRAKESEQMLERGSDMEAKQNVGPAYGVMMIDDKPVTSVRYQRREHEGKIDYNVSFHMGTKTVARVKDVEAQNLAGLVGRENAKTINDKAEIKGSLKGEELINVNALTPEEKDRRLDAIEKSQESDMTPYGDAEAVRQAFEYDPDEHDAALNAQNLDVEADLPEEQNKIEHAPELEQVNVADALSVAARLRQRDREAWEASQADLGLQAEGKRVKVENLSEKAEEQNDSNRTAENTGQTTDYPSQVDTEREKNRQTQLMESLHHQFRVSGPRYHFKDQPARIAFKDKGSKMVTASNDERVAQAMATMADAKGWKTITVSGHPDFQREVWMEASMRGIEVKGFKPKQQDLDALEARRDRQMKNSVEQAPTRDRQKTSNTPEAQRGTATGPEQARSDQRSQDTPSANKSAKAPEKTNLADAPTVRSHSGRLLEHGEANYNHDPDEQKNYYVKIQDQHGKEETVWGVDLKRAMKESKARPGDHVQLDFKGKQPVNVIANVRNEQGKVIGKEEIATERNSWHVQSDRAKVVEAVADKVVDAKFKDPAQREAARQAVSKRLQELDRRGAVPPVPMYDKAAAPRSHDPERARPQVERNSERTR
ncbi:MULTISPECIES: LPD7 domain-containing protein [Pseudomonas syringae group]|uniref:Large polyvalent protein-associated domain-containing protein n=1 Tax=Pseudomonas syringae pv. persicae TaxID=237306 RepID=A0A3M3ZZE8_9PSED|nr:MULTISPECIES: LPD7 domain-containing protein [Pseudomonas syringae group]QOQ33510.1 hypothetical protein [Pseudomonas syringae pv. actinidiae]RMO99509.1 hypothetical protein ALQ30_200516 [Pseudomonas syringae pv. persicae]